MAVRAIPEGYDSVIPYLLVDDAAQQIEFLKQMFGASELSCHKGPDGAISHAEVKIRDSVLMISQAQEEWPAMAAMHYLYVDDVDAVYKAGLAAGGTSVREPRDEFYGDRACGVADPWGNQWWVATHVEDISEEEMQRRMDEMSQQA